MYNRIFKVRGTGQLGDIQHFNRLTTDGCTACW